MPKPFSLIVFLLLAISALAELPAVAPRKSPEFTIAEPSGKIILLSSLKGKVVVMEFLFLKSEHCLRVARTLNKLGAELGPQGFQPVGVVFGPDANEQFVAYLVDSFKLAYPVGYATSENVDSFLGRTRNQILNNPQVVVIDRAGMIRASSGGRGGDPKLEDENSLRTLIDSLLKEGAPQRTAK
jgi:peroxiredoxin